MAEHISDSRISEHLKDPQAKSYLLKFWSVECAPCLKDLKNISLSPEQLLVPINTDSEKQMALAQSLFKSLAPQGLPFLRDPMRALSKDFDIQFVPTEVQLDLQGNVLSYKVGLDSPLRK